MKREENEKVSQQYPLFHLLWAYYARYRTSLAHFLSEWTSSWWSESNGLLPKAFELGGSANIQNMHKMFVVLNLW